MFADSPFRPFGLLPVRVSTQTELRRTSLPQPTPPPLPVPMDPLVRRKQEVLWNRVCSHHFPTTFARPERDRMHPCRAREQQKCEDAANLNFCCLWNWFKRGTLNADDNRVVRTHTSRWAMELKPGGPIEPEVPSIARRGNHPVTPASRCGCSGLGVG